MESEQDWSFENFEQQQKRIRCCYGKCCFTRYRFYLFMAYLLLFVNCYNNAIVIVYWVYYWKVLPGKLPYETLDEAILREKQREIQEGRVLQWIFLPLNLFNLAVTASMVRWSCSGHQRRLFIKMSKMYMAQVITTITQSQYFLLINFCFEDVFWTVNTRIWASSTTVSIFQGLWIFYFNRVMNDIHFAMAGDTKIKALKRNLAI